MNTETSCARNEMGLVHAITTYTAGAVLMIELPSEQYFTANASSIKALADIFLLLNGRLKTIDGEKFVFIDSITTMLMHNKPYVFARFIRSILTKMRVMGVGGVLVSLDTKTNKDVRAEIAQLCDKVIKI